MFDIGWQELFLVALITIIVVGPKELPRVIRTVTLWIRKVRSMAREFQDGIDDLAREADLDDLRKEIETGGGMDLEDEISRTIDPSGELRDVATDIGGALDDAKDTMNVPKIGTERPDDTEPGPRASEAAGPPPKVAGGKTESAG